VHKIGTINKKSQNAAVSVKQKRLCYLFRLFKVFTVKVLPADYSTAVYVVRIDCAIFVHFGLC